MVQASFDLPDIRLAALEGGSGGSPLLLVHGFTGCKEDFADEVEALVELGYHVIAPDLRGHGDSDAPAEEAAYGLERFADDMFALADAAGWVTFDLLGHSMGGMVAQVMVLREPGRIRRLVLMDTHHGVLGDLDPDLIAIGVDLARTQGLKVIQEILQMGTEPGANPAYERACAERPGYRDFAENKMLRCSPAMYAAMLLEMSTVADRLEALASVSVPTLVQVGELDAAFVAASHRMAEIIPGATIDVHLDAAHCPQFESTDSWRASLHGFLGAADLVSPG